MTNTARGREKVKDQEREIYDSYNTGRGNRKWMDRILRDLFLRITTKGSLMEGGLENKRKPQNKAAGLDNNRWI